MAYMSILLLPHFDIICDLPLNRRMTTWNLFVQELSSGTYQANAYLADKQILPQKGEGEMTAICLQQV